MPSNTPTIGERVLCTPDGIRVWRGYRSTSFIDDRDTFDQLIKSIFVPHTAQQMLPLGLQSYFPALLPDSRLMSADTNGRNDILLVLPDEIALVVYPSLDAYDHAAKASVAGRAYGMLHWPMFSRNEPPIPDSLSGHPVPWNKDWDFDTPLALVDDAIDWQTGITEAIVLQRNFKQSKAEYRSAINACVTKWLSDDHAQIDGSILSVNEHYLLYWEHRKSAIDKQSLKHALMQFMGPPYLQNVAKKVIVQPAFTDNDRGVDMSVGEVLDVRTNAYK